jgi:hypothetical protein
VEINYKNAIEDAMMSLANESLSAAAGAIDENIEQ